MKRNPRHVIGGVAVALVVAAALSQMPLFHRGGARASIPALNAALEPLRSDFNRDAGDVRLVMLIDPT
ncbi:MAG TPA: hypothetical protein VE998_12780 [Terriglobales bacterium]|nr:hypothetical protein [Terriglobales bacterium]